MGDYSGIPYVCTLLNCMLWVVYGLPIVKFQVLVVTINAAGCAIEFTYLTLYLIHAAKKIRVRNLRHAYNSHIFCNYLIPVTLLLHVHDQSLLQRRLTLSLMPRFMCTLFAVTTDEGDEVVDGCHRWICHRRGACAVASP